MTKPHRRWVNAVNFLQPTATQRRWGFMLVKHEGFQLSLRQEAS